METIAVNKLKKDGNNLNNHTVRGLGLLSHSLDKYGAGRPILVDKRNNVLAGNAVAEYAEESGINEVVIVDAADDELVIVQRRDLQIDTPMARELAFADNRISELNLEWNVQRVNALFEEIDIANIWTPVQQDYQEEEFSENDQNLIENDVVLYQFRIGKQEGEISREEMNVFKDVFTNYVERTGTSYGFISWLLQLNNAE
jgi:hypothetical protein